MAIATDTGLANGYLDLLDKLNALVTDGGAMGAGAWTQIEDTTSGFTVDGEVWWTAPGLGGTDTIYIGVQTYSDVGDGIYTWRMMGADGFNDDIEFDEQPGGIAALEGIPRLLLRSPLSTFNYRIVANGQRAIIRATVSGVDQVAYLGLVTRYGPPANYPLPLLIAGCNYLDADISDLGNDHCWFLQNLNTDGVSHPAQAQLKGATGEWMRTRKFDVDDLNVDANYIYFEPTAFASGDLAVVPTDANNKYPLLPARITTNMLKRSCMSYLGELDGIKILPGFDVSTGDTVTVGAEVWEVFKNTFRNAPHDFAAMLIDDGT